MTLKTQKSLVAFEYKVDYVVIETLRLDKHFLAPTGYC